MERSCGRSYKENSNTGKEQPWRTTYGGPSYYNGVGDPFLSGFSWPPRSYTCSFCKREFRSAQALGGHMNVHRRDRARLRVQQSPPWEWDLNLSPNHNEIPPMTNNFPANPNFPTNTILNLNIAPMFSCSSISHGHFKPDQVALEVSLSINEILQEKEEVDLELRLGFI